VRVQDQPEWNAPRLRGWIKRHPWLAALIALVMTFVVLYAAFVLKFVWDMQHSTL
jgi:predicted RND superfamily exporter protein